MRKLLVVCGVMIGWLTAYGQSKTLYIDPDKTTGAPASRVFEEMQFIPLQTTKKSIFGAIRQLVVTKDYFVVLDGDTDALYFFSKKGAFIYKYKIKRFRIQNIQLDHSKNALLIFSQNKNYTIPSVKIQQYLEPDSKKDVSRYVKATYFFLDNVPAAKTQDIKNFRYAFTNPVLFDTDRFATSFIKAKKNSRDTLDYQLKIINQTTQLHSYFPYNKQSESAFYFAGAAQCTIMPTHNDSVLFVTRPFRYQIYTLTPSVLKESYKLILPIENAIPASFFSANFQSRGEMDTYKMEHASYASQIDNVIRFNNLIFFNLRLFNGYKRYIFNSKLDLIYDYNKISTDSATCYLPLYGTTIKGFDENYIYLSLSAKSVLNAKKNIQNRTPQCTNGALNQFLQTGKGTDNPVLIRLKPKKDQQGE
ncbi:6-bladed beta-propeller [Niabella ginsenosidivorans]|uniref:6-bladed beta-propeller n=1 Tax=Niabella ginsenosidivorans TaxID=1176587 RepID=A0A1A9I7Y9_9BACT|nr:6-bladed beta-propeller [Niabella ginsenosidivorans]ANH82801.1 6-bladed beta-propeller [Niabella ginsenosidivorans]